MTNLAETALVVGEEWRGRGVGSAMLDLLLDYAKEQAIRGIRAEVLPGNQAMVRLHRDRGHEVRWDARAKVYEIRHLFADEGTKTEGDAGVAAVDAGAASA